MADAPKTPAAGPLREPPPPIYPIPLIEVACRALEALAVAQNGWKHLEAHTVANINAIEDSALRIIRDGLASHEREAKEGRSRG